MSQIKSNIVSNSIYYKYICLLRNILWEQRKSPASELEGLSQL